MATGPGCRLKDKVTPADMHGEELSDEIIGKMSLEVPAYWRVIGKYALGYKNKELDLIQGQKSKTDWDYDCLCLAVEKNNLSVRRIKEIISEVPAEKKDIQVQQLMDSVPDEEMDGLPSSQFLLKLTKCLKDIENICVGFFKLDYQEIRDLEPPVTPDGACMKQMMMKWRSEKAPRNRLNDLTKCFEVEYFKSTNVSAFLKVSSILKDGVEDSKKKSETNQQMINPKNKAAASGQETSKKERVVSELQETMRKMDIDESSQSKGSSIKKGLRIVRGPNWRDEWGNQDGGEGHVGTVIIDNEDNQEEKVRAVWGEVPKAGEPKHLRDAHDDLARMGKIYSYRIGKNYSYDLRVFDNFVIAKTHPRIFCISCPEEEIRGFRWKCTECEDCDLCTYCYMTDVHDVTHSFVRFDAPYDIGCKLSPRSYSMKLAAYNTKPTDWTSKNTTGRPISYYRDHLPLLGMTSEKNGSYSCPFLVGERVIVTLDREVYETLQDGHGGWNSEMAAYIDVIGTVIYANQRGMAEVYYEKCMHTWTMNNKVLTKIGPFSVGQQVTITEQKEVFEKYQKMHCEWHPDLENLSGKQGTVRMVHQRGTLQVKIDTNVWDLSPMCFVSMATTIRKIDKTNLAPIGYRVVRGPDWRWENQDTGEGHVGTVVDYESKKGIVSVKWATFSREDTSDLMQLIAQVTEKRGSYSYRVGSMLSYDLRIIDNGQAGVCHTGVTCVGCQQYDLVGIRWQCSECDEYDLCSFCYMNNKHDLTHEFVRYDTTDHLGMRVSPRCYSPRFQARDLLPGDWSVDNHNETETFYYRDHLPLLEQNEHFPKEDSLFGVAPCDQEDKSLHMIQSVVIQTFECPYTVGDRVIILLTEQQFKDNQEGHGGFNDNLLACMGRVGCVVFSHREDVVEVHFDGFDRSWALNASSLTKLGPFALYDEVTVTQDLALVEKYQQKHADWHPDLVQVLGKTGKVLDVYNSGNLRVKIGDFIWEFSPVCFVSATRAGQSSTAVPALGTRVVRGPSWQYEDQDQGEGHLGSVTKYDLEKGKVGVLWDGNARRGNYRAGAKNLYDMRILDYGEKCTTKFPKQCKGCFLKPIRGILWKCSICDGFDFCTVCYMSDKHHLNHPFIRFTSLIDTEGVKLSARCYSCKIEAQNSAGPDWAHNMRMSGVTPFYYRDHLPLMGYHQAVYDTRTDHCVGDRVIVAPSVDRDTAEFIDRLGTIVYRADDDHMCVYFEHTMRTRNIQSAALKKVGPFMIEEPVTVVKNEELVKRYQMKHAEWQDEIKRVVGKTGTLIGITLTGNLMVQFCDEGVLVMSPMCFLVNQNIIPSMPTDLSIPTSLASHPDLQAVFRALAQASPAEQQRVKSELEQLVRLHEEQ